MEGEISIKPALDWVYAGLIKGLSGGAVDITLSRHEETRTSAQNSKQWPMYHDFANQILWYGSKMHADDWKDLLGNEYQNQKIVPALSGGFCVIGVKTCK